MKIATRQTDIALWHYTCPSCGVGSEETGYHAPAHMIYCEVCLEDSQQVRLKRWPAVEDASGTAPRGRLGGG